MLKSLTISRLSRGATNSAYLDVQRALEAVLSMATPQPWRGPSYLKCLKFRDINFAPFDSMCQAFSIFMLVPSNVNFHCVSFEDVNPRFLEDLTRFTFLNANCNFAHSPSLELHLTCGASSRDIPVNAQSWQYARLVLEGSDHSHLTASYPFDEHCFLSSELHLINCRSFTNSELEVLSRIDPETKAPLFSTNLKHLKLTNCRSFTVKALKDMVTARAISWQRRSRIAGWKNELAGGQWVWCPIVRRRPQLV